MAQFYPLLLSLILLFGYAGRIAVTVFDPSGARNALHVIELTGSGG